MLTKANTSYADRDRVGCRDVQGRRATDPTESHVATDGKAIGGTAVMVSIQSVLHCSIYSPIYSGPPCFFFLRKERLYTSVSIIAALMLLPSSQSSNITTQSTQMR
jgi:hypothetical protein